MQLLFDMATGLTKLSMLALIYRVTVAGSSRMRYAVVGLDSVVACASVAFIIVKIFQCRCVNPHPFEGSVLIIPSLDLCLSTGPYPKCRRIASMKQLIS